MTRARLDPVSSSRQLQPCGLAIRGLDAAPHPPSALSTSTCLGGSFHVLLLKGSFRNGSWRLGSSQHASVLARPGNSPRVPRANQPIARQSCEASQGSAPCSAVSFLPPPSAASAMESRTPQAKSGAPGHEFGIETCTPSKYAPIIHRHCACLGLAGNCIVLQEVLAQS